MAQRTVSKILHSGLFKKFLRSAKSYIRNPSKLKRLLTATVSYARKEGKNVKDFVKHLDLLVGMLKAWITGNYKKIPTKTLLLIIGALLYFLDPLDLIPDYLPFGFVDDAAIISWVLVSIADDVKGYQKWKRSSSRRRRR